MSEEYAVEQLLLRIDELELAARPVDDRLEKMQAAYEKKVQGLLRDVRELRSGRYNWRTYDGTPETLPGENVECVVWAKWRQDNGCMPSEINLYLRGSEWIGEDGMTVEELKHGDKWIPWDELWS